MSDKFKFPTWLGLLFQEEVIVFNHGLFPAYLLREKPLIYLNTWWGGGMYL